MRGRSERSARLPAQGKTLVRAIRAISEPRNGCLSSVRQCVVHEGVHRSFPRAAQCARSRSGGKRSAWRKCGQQFPDSLANVGVLLPGLAATPSPDRTEAHTDSKERSDNCTACHKFGAIKRCEDASHSKSTSSKICPRRVFSFGEALGVRTRPRVAFVRALSVQACRACGRFSSSRSLVF